MTKLELELNQRGITIYQIVKSLGKHNSAWGNISAKIKGKIAINEKELFEICAVVEKLGRSPINPQALDVEVVKINKFVQLKQVV